MRMMMTFAGFAVAAAAFGPRGVTAPNSDGATEFPHAVHTMLISDCATCHGVTSADGAAYPQQVFCSTCHNGSVAPEVNWTPPEEHVLRNTRFDHAKHIAAAGNECQDCHVTSGSGGSVVKLAVLERCSECHAQTAVSMTPSPWHGSGWVDRHGAEAAAAPSDCASCHVRQDCLDCHRPDAGSGSPGYHRTDFLAGHATAAYSRETSCNDCHNPGAFCASCHKQAGLVTGGDSQSMFHNAGSGFITSHGQAARQSLETCVACHTESDCIRCHSTMTGQINPHGSDWDGDDLAEKNPRMCIACHGNSIPDDEGH